MKRILRMQNKPNLEKMRDCKHFLWFDELGRVGKKIYRKLRKAKEKERTMKIIIEENG